MKFKEVDVFFQHEKMEDPFMLEVSLVWILTKCNGGPGEEEEAFLRN